jgi:hypothetical protein
MRLALAATAVIMLAPGALSAQEAEDRKAEVGVGMVGLSVYSTGSETVTVVGAPHATFFAPATIYASFFVSRRLALEPQAGVIFLSQNGGSYHLATFAGQVDYFFKDRQRSSPYVFGRGSLTTIGGDEESDTSSSLGGGLGYRFPVGGRALLRVEGRFDHRFEQEFESSVNTFSLSFSLGLAL